ncbi:MAG: hypothetical protein HQK50_13145 [Oligoflexia bacterium]|nr:hypothetical protein [Oligoflexia bacterium]MBF0366512.1 hypothetical protein [Oligoflexia bacterium]
MSKLLIALVTFVVLIPLSLAETSEKKSPSPAIRGLMIQDRNPTFSGVEFSEIDLSWRSSKAVQLKLTQKKGINNAKKSIRRQKITDPERVKELINKVYGIYKLYNDEKALIKCLAASNNKQITFKYAKGSDNGFVCDTSKTLALIKELSKLSQELTKK